QRGARPRRLERDEVRDFAVAEHLHSIGVELRHVAGQRQPRLLETGLHDRTVETAPARDDAQPERRSRRLEQLADRNAQYLSSSSRMIRKSSPASTASMRRARKLASFSSREMRASAFRCVPAESSGATRRKKRCVGLPSSELKSTPAGLRPKAAITPFTPGSFPCGRAPPSPSAVLFSRSGSWRACTSRSRSMSRCWRTTTPASSAMMSALVRPARTGTITCSFRMSVIFMGSAPLPFHEAVVAVFSAVENREGLIRRVGEDQELVTRDAQLLDRLLDRHRLGGHA